MTTIISLEATSEGRKRGEKATEDLGASGRSGVGKGLSFNAGDKYSGPDLGPAWTRAYDGFSFSR